VNVRRSRPFPAEPAEELRVKHNASIPTLADQFLAPTQAAAIRNEPPEPMTESDNSLQLAKDVTKPLNPHRPDKELGDLDWRFSEDTGRFVMDEEVGHLNSQLVIEEPENGAMHVLHGGPLELYLADRLRDLDHPFENVTDLPDVQTYPLRMTHYPQGRDDFTNNLSVARSNGNAYKEYLSKVKVSVPLLIKFVLEHGESNVAQDGELVHNDLNVANGADGDSARDPKGTEPVQRHRVMFGCCGQASSDEYVDGHCTPKSTYGFDVLDKVEDEEKREKIITMVGDLFNCMQECKDYIETVKLKNSLPFYHKGRKRQAICREGPGVA
jgi:hypothetical protein